MDKNVKRDFFKYAFILFSISAIFSFFLIAFNFVIAVENIESTLEDVFVLNASVDALVDGKNTVVFDEYITVEELIGKNNFIESVSYYDPLEEKTIGYVNFFGGLGKNFLIIPGNEYEIFSSSKEKLKL